MAVREEAARAKNEDGVWSGTHPELKYLELSNLDTAALEAEETAVVDAVKLAKVEYKKAVVVAVHCYGHGLTPKEADDLCDKAEVAFDEAKQAQKIFQFASDRL